VLVVEELATMGSTKKMARTVLSAAGVCLTTMPTPRMMRQTSPK
jgi:hypothetical protein